MRSLVLCACSIALITLVACQGAPVRSAPTVLTGVAPPPRQIASFTLGEGEHLAGDSIVAAAQPSEERIARLDEAFTHLISLRDAEANPFDEAAAASARGLAYQQIAVNDETIRDRAVREQVYDLFTDIEVNRHLAYVHGDTGLRVAALWMLYLVERKGVSESTALEHAHASGLATDETMVRGILEAHEVEQPAAEGG